MKPAPEPQPRQRRYSVRHQVRLDKETYATLEALVKTFHQKRGPILRYVMQWGITHSRGWLIEQALPTSVRLIPMLIEPALLQQVQDAANAHGTSVAAWVRQAMRQVTRANFPPSWLAGETTPQSHDSQYYGKRFMLRLDGDTETKLETLTQVFDRPAAEIIRQLITQAKPGDFPESWQLAAEESRVRRPPPRNSQRSTPTGPRRPQTWRKTDA